jgi:Peptidase inhibitor family I36
MLMEGPKMKLRALIVTASLVGASIAGSIASPASAAEKGAPSTQSQINEQIAKYGGTQISQNEVSYNNGSVVMVFPDASGKVPTSPSLRTDSAVAASSYPYGCPSGVTQKWYCLYADANFGGRMLQFKDCNSGGYHNNLADYGFANQTSSWVNAKTDTQVNAYDYNFAYLWHEGPASASSYVGAANNDKATDLLASC